MKTKTHFTLFLLAASLPTTGQSLPTSQPVITGARAASSPTLPPYLVYRHFLAWVNELDKQATAAGATDPYQFAQPFSRAGLQHPHLDILRAAAHQLDADLTAQKARAAVIVARYRSDARAAVSQGQPFPPAPAAIRDLDHERTALLINHYATLRAALGPDVSTRLDNYLKYEFTPHINLRRMLPPGTPAAH
jgi:hypothetical protein